jgi:WD40 domain-containing protein
VVGHPDYQPSFTLGYEPPEAHEDGERGQPQLPWDVWAFGITLVEAASGRHPADGLARRDWLLRLLGAEPLPLPRLPAPLARAVGLALAKAPERRGTIAAVLAALDEPARAVGVPPSPRPSPLPGAPASDPWANLALVASGTEGGGGRAALSPDGLWLATADSWNKTARPWEVASGRELQRFVEHNDPVMSVAFAPDGRGLATGSGDHTARLWDPASGRELRRLEGHSDPVMSVAFAPDGRGLATGSWDHTARLWEVASGRELVRIHHLDDGRQLVLYGDGRSYWGTDGIEQLLSLVRGMQVIPVPAGYRARHFGPRSPDDVRRLLGLAAP